MSVVKWALGVKPDLIRLQRERGIPALFAAAQMCHESAVDGGAGLSELATQAHNYAGLKWAEWEREYGCEPVTYGTWEHIDGQDVALDDAFCRCPDWATWLRVYGDLLTGRYYGGALAYKDDPFLFGYHIWSRGWATDPAYLTGLANWMAELWDDYADTLPGRPPQHPQVTVLIDDRLAEGDYRLVDSRTVGPVGPFAAALTQAGWLKRWDQDTKTLYLVRLHC